MVVTTIAEENRAAFERLMPENLSVRLNREGWFGLGGIHTVDGENRAAGALVFNIEEGSNGDENLIAAQIQWLYVAEKFRRQGIAEALLLELFRVLEQANIAHILCDIPMDAAYNELCAYLESWGFTVSLTDVYEAELTAADFASHPAVQNGGDGGGVIPLSKILDAHFRQYLHMMKRLPYVPDSLSAEIRGKDETVSCVCQNNGAVEGALLVQRQADVLEVMHFRTINNNSPPCCVCSGMP
jgi:ribosomal protein S18 acetylase RimI-like enzyme